MGNVYVKKASGPAGIIGDLAQSVFGGSKEEVAEAAAKKQLANFDYGRNPSAALLPGDKDAGSLGPKDRHGNQQWIPANAAGRHDVKTQEALTSAAARGIPYARLLSLGLGGLSAIDSLAEAQPGQSGLGMLHNAATRGYLSHLGAKSFLDPAAASLASRHGRRALERTNPYNLVGAVHGPPRGPPPPPTPPTPPTLSGRTTVPASTLTGIDTLLNTTAPPTPLSPETVVPSAPDLTNVTPDPTIEETVQNPSAKSGTEIMQQYVEQGYPFGADTSKVGGQAGATKPGVDEHSAEAQKLLMENMANQEYWEQFGG